MAQVPQTTYLCALAVALTPLSKRPYRLIFKSYWERYIRALLAEQRNE